MGKKLKRKCLILLMIAILLFVNFGFSDRYTVFAKEGEDEILTDLAGATVKVGDFYKFGHFEQDGNLSNGKEEIEWQILSIQDDGILMVSRYCLDRRQFSDEWWDTWYYSTLRTWLNNEFYNAAFSQSEKSLLKGVDGLQLNILHPESIQSDCIDKVFLLTRQEVMETIGYVERGYSDHSGFSPELMVSATPYAISHGAVDEELTKGLMNDFNLSRYGYTKSDLGRRGTHWYLRTTGRDWDTLGLDTNGQTWYVSSLGFINVGCSSFKTDTDVAVRPAVYLKVKVNPTAINLNTSSVTTTCGKEISITAKLTPADVLNNTITWSSNNPAVASVSNGVVKAGKVGKATITAKTANGLTKSCEVVVLADTDSSNPFADVAGSGWQYSAARYVCDNGYMGGKGELIPGKIIFDPNAPITRSQFVQILYNVEGNPAVEYSAKFSDVPNGEWYTKAVLWAANKGIVGGNPNGSFAVGGKATREQIASMFYKYAVYKGYDTSVVPGSGKKIQDFSDGNKVSSWAENALNWALSRGIMSGTGSGTLNPQSGATRVECAVMLRNFMNTYKNAPRIFMMESDGMEMEDFLIIDEVEEEPEITEEPEEEPEITEEPEEEPEITEEPEEEPEITEEPEKEPEITEEPEEEAEITEEPEEEPEITEEPEEEPEITEEPEEEPEITEEPEEEKPVISEEIIVE